MQSTGNPFRDRITAYVNSYGEDPEVLQYVNAGSRIIGTAGKPNIVVQNKENNSAAAFLFAFAPRMDGF